MGRIAANVTITNLFDKGVHLNWNAPLDIGAAYMTLPTAWKPRLGKLTSIRTVNYEPAKQ